MRYAVLALLSLAACDWSPLAASQSAEICLPERTTLDAWREDADVDVSGVMADSSYPAEAVWPTRFAPAPPSYAIGTRRAATIARALISATGSITGPDVFAALTRMRIVYRSESAPPSMPDGRYLSRAFKAPQYGAVLTILGAYNRAHPGDAIDIAPPYRGRRTLPLPGVPDDYAGYEIFDGGALSAHYYADVPVGFVHVCEAIAAQISVLSGLRAHVDDAVTWTDGVRDVARQAIAKIAALLVGAHPFVDASLAPFYPVLVAAEAMFGRALKDAALLEYLLMVAPSAEASARIYEAWASGGLYDAAYASCEDADVWSLFRVHDTQFEKLKACPR